MSKRIGVVSQCRSPLGKRMVQHAWNGFVQSLYSIRREVRYGGLWVYATQEQYLTGVDIPYAHHD
ncbi:MAG: hypothetical protein RLZZ612_533 [Pseudomonadota bacterium]